mmetsp:Transcript_41069/g.63230  ORF Transcript_41069/g.63230 Transcript_41069/m.63230 type:complete len:258 (-) Transcript_41069:23-796(-)
MVGHVVFHLLFNFGMCDGHDRSQTGGVEIGRSGSESETVSGRRRRSSRQLLLGLLHFRIIGVLHVQLDLFNIGMREFGVDEAASSVLRKVLGVIRIIVQFMQGDINGGLRSGGDLSNSGGGFAILRHYGFAVGKGDLLHVVGVAGHEVERVAVLFVLFAGHLILQETIDPSSPGHHGVSVRLLCGFVVGGFHLADGTRSTDIHGRMVGSGLGGGGLCRRMGGSDDLGRHLLSGLLNCDGHLRICSCRCVERITKTLE